MKAYRFRLETVARVRRVQEELAGQELAKAARARHLARQVLTERQAALDGLDPVSGLVPATEAHWSADQGARQQHAVTAATGMLEEADAQLDEARTAWLTARRKTAVLDRLDERQRAAWEVEDGREQAKELDELATGRHQAREVEA